MMAKKTVQDGSSEDDRQWRIKVDKRLEQHRSRDGGRWGSVPPTNNENVRAALTVPSKKCPGEREPRRGMVLFRLLISAKG